MGPDKLGSYTVQNSFTTDHALRIFDAVPDDIKDDPINVELAMALALLGNNAGRGVPSGCARLLPNTSAYMCTTTVFTAPGSRILTGSDTDKLISFVYNNMDEGHYKQWGDLTGHQQGEWITAWIRNQRTHLRRDDTKGLAGTNLTTLNTGDLLAAAAALSPTLAERIPLNHTVPVGERPAKRRLFHAQYNNPS